MLMGGPSEAVRVRMARSGTPGFALVSTITAFTGDQMAQKKPLNIGLVGYGFMGRPHSNAYKRVNDFFDVEYRPVLKAVCARNADNAEAFAEKWGYESIETDWRKLVD